MRPTKDSTYAEMVSDLIASLVFPPEVSDEKSAKLNRIYISTRAGHSDCLHNLNHKDPEKELHLVGNIMW